MERYTRKDAEKAAKILSDWLMQYPYYTGKTSSFRLAIEVASNHLAGATAVPELLGALKALLVASDCDPSEPIPTSAVRRLAAAQGKAQAAIRKAEGGPQ